jgi:apolipoprotein N-acyltransferase
MGFANSLKWPSKALLACAATAVLLYFGNGLQPCWPLMWFAPLPVLLFSLRGTTWQTTLVAFFAWLAGSMNLWHYFLMLGVPSAVWLGGFGLSAAAFTASVLLMCVLARRGFLWCAWLGLPAAWISFEFIRNLLGPHGSALSVAYSQLNFLPFLQTASLAGPWGMGFVLMLFPAGLALGMDRWRKQRKQALRILGATACILTALLAFGAVRLAMPQCGPLVTVGLVASGANGGAPVNDPGAPTQRLFENYAWHAGQLIARGAQVVVMPEDMGVVLDSDIAKTDAIFQPIADRTGAMLVVGMAHVGAAGRHNEARIYSPGEAVRIYDKEHLLPPFETSRFTPGTFRTLLTSPSKFTGQTWAVTICKDMDFTNPARAYGLAGTGLMLTPAWDSRLDSFWHGHIAVMRAVEDGFSLARASRNGLLTVADNRGRIIAETTSDTAAFSMVLATVPTGHSHTLFLLLGDWFGWCAIALLALVLVHCCEVTRLPRHSASTPK